VVTWRLMNLLPVAVAAAALVSLAGVSPVEARAADDLESTAEARALFEDGLAHADAGRWSEAADRFERARLLRPSPEITYNLTTALVHQGKLVRASELLRQVLAEPQATPPVKEASTARLAELLPRLAHLTIEVPAAAAGTTVVVDQRPFDAARLGVALPMDPTVHSLELRRGQALVERREVTLREGERRTVSLDKGGPGSALVFSDPGLLAKDVAPPAAADRPSGRSRAWIWAAVGALAIGVTTTAIIASRDSPAPPAGNVDTWTLGR
jgi:hypothetical protein